MLIIRLVMSPINDTVDLEQDTRSVDHGSETRIPDSPETTKKEKPEELKPRAPESIHHAEMYEMDNGSTQRGLKNRHAQMIALGGSIGTGYAISTINPCQC